MIRAKLNSVDVITQNIIEGWLYYENDQIILLYCILQEGDAGAFVSDIFDVDTKNGKVYLARLSSISSNVDAYQSINLFKIEGNSLNDKIKLIKIKSGLTNTLGFGYDFFSVVDRKERPIKLIFYDKATKTIKIPVVIVDKDFRSGKVTGKFINYKFDGTYFLKQK